MDGAAGSSSAEVDRATMPNISLMTHEVDARRHEIDCNEDVCSVSGVCCGIDKHTDAYYCASHCSCVNSSRDGVHCPCDVGFHGVDCAQEISPTVWLAVILSVGTLLVLFIAWGFRCQEYSCVTAIG